VPPKKPQKTKKNPEIQMEKIQKLDCDAQH
jgi:hypothetical protein